MALGAIAKYGKEINIVPCGLTYYRGHRFRCKVVVQFGVPYTVPKEIIQLYKENKAQAITLLLAEISQRLKAVTITAQSHAEINAYNIARRLYLPANKKLPTDEEFKLTQRFQQAFDKFKEHPVTIQLINDIKKYALKISALKIEENLIQFFKKGLLWEVCVLIYNIILAAITFIIGLPALMLNGSIGLLLRYLAEKNRIKEAEAFPNPCLDVVASYKILTALVIFPVAGLLYYLFFYLIMRFYVFPNDPARYNNFTIYFIILWPIYTFYILKIYDNFKLELKYIRSYILIIFGYKELLKLEKELQQRVRSFVDSIGSQIFESINMEKY